ncbi:MAG: hypothetical protein Q9207_000107 [Kuettlingeria erythrocarpa]
MLAEILKDSPIPPGNLLRVIQAERIQPRWTEIALPYGPAPQLSPTTKTRKRPGPGSESSTALNRELQPRTPGFVTVNEPTEATAYPPALIENADQRKKKRGRPSKAEIEVRTAEYAARGEPYPHPPPRRPKNPKPSSEGTFTAPSITFTPVSMGPSGAESSASGKKRAAKAKAAQDVSLPEYGTLDPPIQQFRNEAAGPGHTTDAPSQVPQSVGSESVSLGIASASQDQTLEGREATETYQPRDTPLDPHEGFLNREAPSSEYRRGVGGDILHTGGTPRQQHAAEPDSPKAMLSPEHK